MRWLWLSIVKMLAAGVVFSFVLPAFHVGTWMQIWSAAVTYALAAFVVGDLFVLPRFGNLVATTVDAVGAWLLLWGFFDDRLSPSGYAVAIAATAALEWFGHRYIEDRLLEDTGRAYDNP